MTAKSKTKTDWTAVDRLSDEDIDQAIAADPDAAPEVANALSTGQFRRIATSNHVPDIIAIRARSGLSQRAFANRYGLDLRALQDWEQGRRQPTKSLHAYLHVIDKNGDMVAATLAETN